MASIRDRIAFLNLSNEAKNKSEGVRSSNSLTPRREDEQRPTLPPRPKSNQIGCHQSTAPRGLSAEPLDRPTTIQLSRHISAPSLSSPPSNHINLIDLEDDEEPDRPPPEHRPSAVSFTSQTSITQDRSNPLVSTLEQAKRGIEEGSKRTINTLAKTFDVAGNNTKQVFNDSVTTLGKIAPPTFNRSLLPATITETQDDFTDLIARKRGKPGLCSNCVTIPWDKIFTSDSTSENEYMEWSTPLARILSERNWCMGCKLFLSMLCRKEFDPLQHPEVAPYIEHDALKGITMQAFVEGGWADDDEHWPFGRSEHRYEGASHYLGPLRETTEQIVSRGGQRAGSIMLSSLITGKPTIPKRRAAANYRDGYRQAQKDQRRHPLGCVLALSIATFQSKTPGLIFADLVGFGGRPGGPEQTLSSFTMQAVKGGFTVSCRPGVPLYYGLKLDSEWINTSVGRLWIAECELQHASQCDHGWSIAEQKPSFLRLIELSSLTLVEVSDTRKSRYVCLSYVWGGATVLKLQKTNVKELTRPGGLKRYLHMLPRTIIDAMEVTKSLGENFLWVDSLCILQEDVPESLEQISQMDRVYGSALLTIVAADGQDADGGLKGVRREYFMHAGQKDALPRQLDVPSAQWSSDVCVNAPFPTRQNVAVSKWETRAWTFQERLLSRRLLIFAGNEMIWHCRGAIWREDTSIAQSAYPPKPLKWLSLKPQYLGVGTDDFWQDGSIERTRHSFTYLVRSGTFAEYASLVEQYTRRKLTYDGDVLKAMAGLSQILALCFQSEFLEGLPSILLDIALLWRPLEVLRRRETDDVFIPSWSWAGWKGRVKYDRPISIARNDDDTTQTMEIEDIRPLLRYFMLNDTTRRLEPINGTARGMPLTDDQLPPEWDVHAPRPSCRDGLHDCRNPTLATINPATISHLSTKHLVFYASISSSFRVGTKVSSAEGQSRSNTPLEILDGEGHIIGSIMLDSGSLEPVSTGQRSFIVVAEAHTSGLPQELTNGLFQYYAVMLIGHDDATGISHRLGTGRVLKVSWTAANPATELICLG